MNKVINFKITNFTVVHEEIVAKKLEPAKINDEFYVPSLPIGELSCLPILIMYIKHHSTDLYKSIKAS